MPWNSASPGRATSPRRAGQRRPTKQWEENLGAFVTHRTGVQGKWDDWQMWPKNVGWWELHADKFGAFNVVTTPHANRGQGCHKSKSHIRPTTAIQQRQLHWSDTGALSVSGTGH